MLAYNTQSSMVLAMTQENASRTQYVVHQLGDHSRQGFWSRAVHRKGSQHGAVWVVSIVAVAQLVGAAERVLLLRGVVLDMELPLLGRGAQDHVAGVADVGRLHAALQQRCTFTAPPEKGRGCACWCAWACCSVQGQSLGLQCSLLGAQTGEAPGCACWCVRVLIVKDEQGHTWRRSRMRMQQVLLPLQPRVSVWLLAVCSTAQHQGSPDQSLPISQ